MATEGEGGVAECGRPGPDRAGSKAGS